jgi:DNA-binding response OmpR family regulator
LFSLNIDHDFVLLGGKATLPTSVIMTTPSLTLPPALRAKYMATLETRRSELAQFLEQCEQKSATPDAFLEARRCAHNLHGSGKTYGYPEVSETARILEDELEESKDQKMLAGMVQAVIEACSIALKSTPVVAPASPAPAAAAATTRPVKSSTKPLMLIAEDDASVSEMLKSLFSAETEIIMATNGRQAFEIIETHKPALVILDDNMPEMSGSEVLEKLRQTENLAATQIVMLTANNKMSDIVRGINAGVVDYITKPFEPGRLVTHIKRLLRHLDIKILIADDDSAVRMLLLHKFRKLGFNVLQAEDGEQAWKMAREEKPHLIILDRMMPGMDGLAVLGMVRDNEELRDTPVILLTAKRQNKDVVEGFDIGATDYVVKPFMPDEVVARVMRRLGLTDAAKS